MTKGTHTQPGTRTPVVTAAAFVLIWTLAAWLTRLYGIWLAVGTAAVALSTVALLIDGMSLMGHAPATRAALVGLAAGVVMVLVTDLLYDPVTAIFPALRADAAQLYAAFLSPGRIAAVLLTPVIVSSEEIVWRGFLHRALERTLRPTVAICVGTLLYAAVLVPSGSPLLVLTALGAGFCWTVLRVVTGSLWAPIAAHLVWDVAIVAMQHFANRL